MRIRTQHDWQTRSKLTALSVIALAATACTAAPGEDVNALKLALGEGGSTGSGSAGSGIIGGGTAGTFGGGTAGTFGGAGISGSAGSGMSESDGGVFDPDGGFFPPFGPQPSGHWQFDDCAAGALLADSSAHAADATKTPSVTCVAGVDGSAVKLDETKDRIDVATTTGFELDQQLAVAAWVKPKALTIANLINKQTANKTAFDLALTKTGVAFAVELTNGKRFVSKAPIPLNQWSHVAGLYDGSFVFLFVNGQQVGQVAAAGHIRDLAAPLRIGNNLGNQFYNGLLDELWMSTDSVSSFDLQQLACVRRPATLAVSPLSSGPVDPGVTVQYDVTVTNNDFGPACSPAFFFFSADEAPEGISIMNDQDFEDTQPGATKHFTMSVTGSTDAEPGTYELPFQVFNFSGDGGQLGGAVEYIMNAPVGCFVRSSRELMIRDLSVVEDPIRTGFTSAASDPRTGAWTFGKLMEQMAPTVAKAPAMTEALFKTWLTNQTVNGFSVPARPAIQQLVLDGWPRTSKGDLDLKRAPLRLLAIVNRLDLRNVADGKAGEGRFVFGVLDSFGNSTEFTVILEYRLPAKTTADVNAWAKRWHDLQQLPFPSEQYNAALQAITQGFAGRGAEPARVNGSALSQLRTNEIALSFRWELREFELGGNNGFLKEATVKLTPDTDFIFESPLVAAFVNQNEASILAEQHTVPAKFQNKAFLGGSSFNDLQAWTSSGITNPEARHKFSLNTCNGCHSAAETGTSFLQIFPRELGQRASLSGFLTGITLSDPVTGELRTLNDLQRRNADLAQIVCTSTAPAATLSTLARTATSNATDVASAREGFLAKGIGRVH